MLTLAMIIGLWTTSCVQTQFSNINRGHLIESYEFKESGDFEHTRKWYHDSNCTELEQVEERTGTIEIGHKLKVSIFNENAFAADFHTSAGTDLGAITKKDNDQIQLSRGIPNSYMRNTMLSLFPFTKVR